MLYFNTLPKIFTPDQNGNFILLTNILTRAKLIEKLQDNPMLFYKYIIQDGDTPEILAEKYYGDPFKYWIILYSNQIMDPLWGWPLAYSTVDANLNIGGFLGYINSKYATAAALAGQTPFAYTNTFVQEYQKITTTIDNYSDTTNIQTTSIDFATYSATNASETTYSIPSGSTCTVKISKNLLTLFDYEFNLNEAKREIKIMDSKYSGPMEEQFKTLMSI
jgi:hypothetical protein